MASWHYASGIVRPQSYLNRRVFCAICLPSPTRRILPQMLIFGCNLPKVAQATTF